MTCPVCQKLIDQPGEAVTCLRCHVPHHEACWSSNRGCGVQTCRGAVPVHPGQGGRGVSARAPQPPVVATPPVSVPPPPGGAPAVSSHEPDEPAPPERPESQPSPGQERRSKVSPAPSTTSGVALGLILITVITMTGAAIKWGMQKEGSDTVSWHPPTAPSQVSPKQPSTPSTPPSAPAVSTPPKSQTPAPSTAPSTAPQPKLAGPEAALPVLRRDFGSLHRSGRSVYFDYAIYTQANGVAVIVGEVGGSDYQDWVAVATSDRAYVERWVSGAASAVRQASGREVHLVLAFVMEGSYRPAGFADEELSRSASGTWTGFRTLASVSPGGEVVVKDHRPAPTTVTRPPTQTTSPGSTYNPAGTTQTTTTTRPATQTSSPSTTYRPPVGSGTTTTTLRPVTQPCVTSIYQPRCP